MRFNWSELSRSRVAVVLLFIASLGAMRTFSPLFSLAMGGLKVEQHLRGLYFVPRPGALALCLVMLGATLAQVLVAIPLRLITRTRRPRPGIPGPRVLFTSFVLGIGVALIASLVNLWFAHLFHATEMTQTVLSQVVDLSLPGERLVALLALGIVGPLGEEFYFRATLQEAAETVLGSRMGVLLSAVLFILAHESMALMPSITLYTVLVSGLYDRYRSFWPSFLAHAGINIAAACMVWL